jgi:hypothetical protein
VTKVQLLSVLGTAALFLIVFELVRRKRLLERYALLWLFATAVMFGLALWSDALNLFADAVGIQYGPSALFAVGFGFMLILLLHFSLVISRLADQNKVLAQRIGMLQQRLEALATEQPDPVEAAAPEAAREHVRPR